MGIPNVELSKIDRLALQKLATNELNLNKKTVEFLLALTPYIDLDKRVMEDLETIRIQLQIQRKTLQSILKEVFFHKLLFFKGGHYYSNFHIKTSGKAGVATYTQNYKVFSTAKYQNYTKNEQRLFNFILTRSIAPTQWQRYKVMELFKNKKQAKRGLDIFPTFRQLANALLTLVNNGHIEIMLVNKTDQLNTPVLTENTKDNEISFFRFFGKEYLTEQQDVREIKRLSNSTIENRLIQVRVTKKVVEQTVPLVASEKELDILASANNFSYLDIPKKQRNLIINYKNTLFNHFGEVGLTIYRNMLVKFFDANNNLIVEYAHKDKAANIFMNHYILPEIRNIITAAALHQNTLKDSINNTNKPRFNELLCNGYIIPTKYIGSFIMFYTDKGSINHVIDLDRALFQHAINYKNFKVAEKEWNLLKSQKEKIFADKSIIVPEIFENPQQYRDFMYSCAKNGVLHDDNRLIELTAASTLVQISKAEKELQLAKVKQVQYSIMREQLKE